MEINLKVTSNLSFKQNRMQIKSEIIQVFFNPVETIILFQSHNMFPILMHGYEALDNSKPNTEENRSC